MIRRPPRSTLFPYTRSSDLERPEIDAAGVRFTVGSHTLDFVAPRGSAGPLTDRKSTRLNSSHGYISYAVFCLKKKKNRKVATTDLGHSPPRAHAIASRTATS